MQLSDKRSLWCMELLFLIDKLANFPFPCIRCVYLRPIFVKIFVSVWINSLYNSFPASKLYRQHFRKDMAVWDFKHITAVSWDQMGQSNFFHSSEPKERNQTASERHLMYTWLSYRWTLTFLKSRSLVIWTLICLQWTMQQIQTHCKYDLQC